MEDKISMIEDKISMYEYKIEQIREMVKYEEAQADAEKYGAHLSHWSGHGKPINIDEGALKALIRYYRREIEKGKREVKASA